MAKTIDDFIKVITEYSIDNHIFVNDFEPRYQRVFEEILPGDELEPRPIYELENGKWVYAYYVKDRCFTNEFIHNFIFTRYYSLDREEICNNPGNLISDWFINSIAKNAAMLDPEFNIVTLKEHIRNLLVSSLSSLQINKDTNLSDKMMETIVKDMPFLIDSHIGFTGAVRQLVDKFKE